VQRVVEARIEGHRASLWCLDTARFRTHRHGGQCDSLDLEVAHHAERRAVEHADEVRGRDNAVGKHELGRRRSAHATLAFDALAQRKARRARRDVEQRNVGPTGPRARVDDCGVAERGVVDAAVRDPHLGAVEHERVADALRLCAHAQDVGARARLGHGHGADLGAVAGLREPPLFLLLGRVDGDVVDVEHGVGEVGEAEGRVRRGELLVHDARRYCVHAASAKVVVGGDAEEAEVAAVPEECAVKLFVAIMLQTLRVHLRLREGAHHVAECGMFF